MLGLGLGLCHGFKVWLTAIHNNGDSGYRSRCLSLAKRALSRLS